MVKIDTGYLSRISCNVIKMNMFVLNNNKKTLLLFYLNVGTNNNVVNCRYVNISTRNVIKFETNNENQSAIEGGANIFNTKINKSQRKQCVRRLRPSAHLLDTIRRN